MGKVGGEGSMGQVYGGTGGGGRDSSVSLKMFMKGALDR